MLYSFPVANLSQILFNLPIKLFYMWLFCSISKFSTFLQAWTRIPTSPFPSFYWNVSHTHYQSTNNFLLLCSGSLVFMMVLKLEYAPQSVWLKHRFLRPIPEFLIQEVWSATKYINSLLPGPHFGVSLINCVNFKHHFLASKVLHF